MQLLALFLVILTVKSLPMEGGETEQNPNDYTNTAWQAVTAINNDTSSNDQYYYVPIQVLNATTQVVAGTMTSLNVLVGQSSCRKGNLQAAQVTSANCQVTQGGSRALYNVKVWDKPWENFQQISATKIRDVSANESF